MFSNNENLKKHVEIEEKHEFNPYSTLISEDIIPVVPMSKPVGKLYYLDFMPIPKKKKKKK